MTASKRSEVMSRIRGRGNKSTERRMAALLRGNGISGWKLHALDVEGCPDIYFPKLRTAVFLDGCFWHACRKCCHLPTQNHTFWARKIHDNTKRDRRISRSLRKKGVKVVRLWEHDLEKNTNRLTKVIKMLKFRYPE